MSQYFCNPCGELHDDDLIPMVEANSCTEGQEAKPKPDPICANCKHWDKAASARFAKDRIDYPDWDPVEGGPCTEILDNGIDVVDIATYGNGSLVRLDFEWNFGCNRFKSKEE